MIRTEPLCLKGFERPPLEYLVVFAAIKLVHIRFVALNELV